ncbi:Uncharacterized protein Rs2_08189 [Raphanus sativus]|nr:Uncharacterized protein Rs2_08189 [Raphanus sativus]
MPVRNREIQGRSLFSQRGLTEWRRKPITSVPNLALEPAQSPTVPPLLSSPTALIQGDQNISREKSEKQILDVLNEATMQYLNCSDPTEAAARRQRVMAGDARGETENRVNSLLRGMGFPAETGEASQGQQNSTNSQRAQVMQELQEVTQQYLSCADPVEAAARRQRVLEGDATGLLERTADSILLATSQRRPLSPWKLGIKSVSPPGIDFETAMQPSDIEVTPPPERRSLEDQCDETPPTESKEQSLEGRNAPAKLRSIVVSPLNALNEEAETTMPQMVVAPENNISQRDPEKKKKAKTSYTARLRSPSLTPNILRGASSKKRKLSQIQNSPSDGKRRLTGEQSRGHKITGANKRTLHPDSDLLFN